MQLCNWFFCWKGWALWSWVLFLLIVMVTTVSLSSLSWTTWSSRHVGIILFFWLADFPPLTRRIYCTVFNYVQILVSTFLSRSWQTTVSLRRDCSCWVHFCLWRLSCGAGFSAMQRPFVSTGILSMVRPIDPYCKSLSIFFAEIVPSSYVVSLKDLTVCYCVSFSEWLLNPSILHVNSLEGRMALRGYFHQDSLSPVPCHWEAATGRRGDLGVMSQGRLSEVLKSWEAIMIASLKACTFHIWDEEFACILPIIPWIWVEYAIVPRAAKKETFSKISLFQYGFCIFNSLNFLKLRSGSAWNYKCAGHEQILPLYAHGSSASEGMCTLRFRHCFLEETGFVRLLTPAI